MKIKVPKLQLSKNNIFICLYFFAFTLRFFTNVPKMTSALVYVAVGIVVLVYLFTKYATYRRIIALFLIIDFISFINGYINGNETYIMASYNVTAQMFGIQLYIARNKMNMIRMISEMLFWFAVIKVIFFPYIDIYGGIGVSQLLGKNSVSVVMLFFCSIDVIYRYENKLETRYWKYLIGILVSYITDSSGGILCFVIFFLGMFACKKRVQKLSWIKIGLLLFGGIILLLAMGYAQRVLVFLSNDNSRFAIWEMYLNTATYDLKSVLFGGSLSRYDFLYQLKNIHNNFLNWHCFYGLLPMLFFSLLTIETGISYLRNKSWYLVIIWCVLIVRAFTDSIDYTFMPLLVYFTLDIMKYNKRMNVWITP